MSRLILFEGPNKSGKTTLIKKFCAASKFKHITMDRGWISNILYAYARDNTIHIADELYSFVQNASRLQRKWPKLTIVHVTANKEDIQRRCQLSNELKSPLKDEIEMFSFAMFLVCGFGFENVITINTSKSTFKQSTEFLISEINKLEEKENDKTVSNEN